MIEKYNEIIYVGYFDTSLSGRNHLVSPAGSKKMEYISDVLADNAKSVKLLSVALPIDNAATYFPSEDIYLKNNVNVHFLSGFSFPSALKLLSIIWSQLCLIFYFFKEVKRNQLVVIYHSMAYVWIVLLLKKIIKYKLILEVEEIYQDVKTVSPINAKLEKELFSIADAFIFPCEILNSRINKKSLPSLIVYGNYSENPKVINKIDDGKIHIIYSGTFERRKGGVDSAILAGEYLDHRYHIHITGKGDKQRTDEIKTLISETVKKSACSISYDGFIKEQDFIKYLQQFHIGLCTQNPDDQLSSSCFPSKILMYMSNGLSVLSSKVQTVLSSRVAPFITFYSTSSPNDIAEMVKKMSIDRDTRDVVKKLDAECRSQAKSFFKEIIARQ